MGKWRTTTVVQLASPTTRYIHSHMFASLLHMEVFGWPRCLKDTSEKFWWHLQTLFRFSRMSNTWKCAPKTIVSKALFRYPSPSAQVGFMTLLWIAMVEYLSMFWKHYEWTIVLQKLGFLSSRLHSRLNGQLASSITKGPTMMESLAIAHKSIQNHSQWNKTWRIP